MKIILQMFIIRLRAISRANLNKRVCVCICGRCNRISRIERKYWHADYIVINIFSCFLLQNYPSCILRCQWTKCSFSESHWNDYEEFSHWVRWVRELLHKSGFVCGKILQTRYQLNDVLFKRIIGWTEGRHKSGIMCINQAVSSLLHHIEYECVNT
jgi:hypothetical protein